jgi:hypothetical protein
MSIRENIHQVIDLIKPQHILVSVFDKIGLEELIKGIFAANPDARFYSTGGTGKKISEILGADAAKNYIWSRRSIPRSMQACLQNGAILRMKNTCIKCSQQGASIPEYILIFSSATSIPSPLS